MSIFSARVLYGFCRLCFVMTCLVLCACTAGETQQSTLSPDHASVPSEEIKEQSESNLSIPPDLLPGALNVNEGLRELKGIKGVKVEQLFSANIPDLGQRTERLENVVTDIYRDLETLKPAIVRLVAIEKDIQELVDMLSEDTDIPDAPPNLPDVEAQVIEESAGGVEQDAPVDLKSADDSEKVGEGKVQENENEKVVAAAQTQTAEVKDAKVPKTVPAKKGKALSSTLKSIRVGDHDTYVRVVVELQKKHGFSVDLDVDANLLTLLLPDFPHDEIQSQPVKSTRSISDYVLIPDANGKGSQIIFALSESFSIKKKIGYSDSLSETFKIIVDLEKR